MSRKRILLVVEGKKQEVSLFRALFACYRLDLEYEIFPYGTNIYELYERMFADGAQDDLTLLGVLKERAPAEDRWLFDQNYYKRLKSEARFGFWVCACCSSLNARRIWLMLPSPPQKRDRR